jgi:hypothetical protein
MDETKTTKSEANQRKTKGKAKKKSKTLGELFAGLPTLPANTRLPRIVSIGATVDMYEIPKDWKPLSSDKSEK